MKPEELRELACDLDVLRPGYTALRINEAADLIEQQAAEIERLRESLAAWEKEAAILAEERNRLRAGMKAILAAANNTGAAESRLSACKQIAAESIGEG